jgi:hypothetical protein
VCYLVGRLQAFLELERLVDCLQVIVHLVAVLEFVVGGAGEAVVRQVNPRDLSLLLYLRNP